MRREMALILGMAVAHAWLCGCSTDALPEDAANAAGLHAYMSEVRTAALAGKPEAAALTRQLRPDAASLERAIRDDAAEARRKIEDGIDKMWPADDAALAAVFAGQPERSQIEVHAATPEDLGSDEDTAATKEFPGGARQAAKSTLRPGVTFYEVEFLEAGKDLGMKYHLFFHDGAGWKMLGPVWRWLR